MRTLQVICLGIATMTCDMVFSEDAGTGPVAFSAPAPAPAPVVTPADLQNLVACARMKLPDLTPEQMVAVAQAIKHAEEQIAAGKKAAP